MGFVWNPTGIEAGIDGYIEIRDTVTGEMTNFVIQVQSKATDKDFQAETIDGFDYYCDARDLDYWMGGNAPVILIRSRPSTNEAYWVSIKDYFKDLSKRATKKVHFDKVKDKFDAKCKDGLVELAKPSASGIYLAPLPKTEKLVSNLLPVLSFGEKIYIAETKYRSPKTLWEKLRGLVKEPGNEWILNNKQIISFHDLNEFPWSEICLGAAEEFDAEEWAYTTELEKRNIFVQLLNLALSQKLSPDVRLEKKLGYYFFAATKNLAPKELSYKSLIQNTSRVVFQGYKKKKDPTQISHYRHSAFFGQFYCFDNKWYLEISPTYHFTWDGYKPSLFREDQLTGIKQLERNSAVLGQVVMWGEYLKDKPDLFSKPYPFLRFGSLVQFEIQAGFDDKTWLKKEEREESDTATLPENQPLLFE
ncbi:MAG: hypothetical protein JETCAE02_23480 [Anaerolineaceae bacterium]|nr:MAG: hypothetical protein BroJett001_01030 [Chloroflexota bacterium]GJQ39936.1 MAG: hypothetical protein JETCAE02_23480 [Anaerolineaceae bacterium]